jgi:hypothetical protein
VNILRHKIQIFARKTVDSYFICSVHVTIGIDTQDVTWQHAIHAFIDSQPPVFSRAFFKTAYPFKSFNSPPGTCPCFQSGCVRFSASCCDCDGSDAALPTVYASAAAAAAAAAEHLFAIVYSIGYAVDCCISISTPIPR